MRINAYRIIVCLFLSSIIMPNSWGQVVLPRLVSDGMVLQRDAPVKIWGWSTPDEDVVVSLKSKDYRAKVNADGEWEVIIPPQQAGGPYAITVNNIIINDVLFGDVWICSGQSNMDLPIKRVLDLYEKEVVNESNPNIRLFRVPTKYNFEHPQKNIYGGEWKAVTPENILEFSATAYFFGKDLYDKYNVPIGLINPSQGGTPIEAWVSEDVIKKYTNHFEKYKLSSTDGYIDDITKRENEEGYKWDVELNEKDKGINNWNKREVDDSDWGTMNLPGYWADTELGQLNGSVWFRKDFEVPKSMLGKDAVLRLGCIVDSDSAFINGEFVGTTGYQYPPRIYTIPASLLNEGKNNISIRVINNGGRGGFVYDKPYKIISNDSEIDLTGTWKYKVGAQMNQRPSSTVFQNYPVGLYNAMIHPIINYKIKGVIWYQGESNIGRAEEYRSLMSDMIHEWRLKWDAPQLPFLYVQLPNFLEPQKYPGEESGWAEMREVQRQTLSIPNTGMAITIDIGEWNDIHPLNKKDVGHRLALLAQKVAYDEKDIVSSGPLFQDIKREGGKVVLTFSTEGSKLISDVELKGFAIAGADGKYVWAKADIIDKDKIAVWSDSVNMDRPLVIKYAWADNPDKANLRNKEGLPASPFIIEIEK